MHECDPQPLGAYLDHELAPDDRAAVEAHLAACASCRAQLAGLRDASQMIQSYPFEPLTADELARVHDAIDRDDDQVVWRLGMVITALAASVLIVACAWLAELPVRRSGEMPVAVAAEPWERVAVTLHVDPLSIPATDSIQLADAELADWMLDGLSGASR